MYITTFYSFKGGVGRSMALVNAGVELAQRNRRVLLVDFDLEAPGLDTFKSLVLKEPKLGIVEFVNNYISSGKIGNVEEYVTKCKTVADTGDIWLMSAGGSKSKNYASSFQNINWDNLYENQDGYILMEDLKQQWKEKINPDYVLIDSRTGHTDIGGICTRQLPDAVAIFYFPNNQNLRGIDRVVREIRAELKSPREKDIQLHFIMSNVPDLDDEHEILKKQIDTFKTKLQLDAPPLRVHRYDSLSLLNQTIFTQTRRNSRLANEYGQIVDHIVNGNLSDRQGAINFLEKIERKRYRRWDIVTENPETRKKLNEIEENHKADGEILFALASWYDRNQNLDKALSFYDQSIKLGFDKPNVYLSRARVSMDMKNWDDAKRDAFHILNLKQIPVPLIKRVLRFVPDNELHIIANTHAIDSLNVEQRVDLFAPIFLRKQSLKNELLPMMQPIIHSNIVSVEDENLCRDLGLVYIALGKFELAKKLFSGQENSIISTFNHAVASWGENNTPDREQFKNVIKFHEESTNQEDKYDKLNYLQCIALAYWASGNQRAAIEYVEKVRQILEADPDHRSFSCWRYHYVSKTEFFQDIQAMEQMIKGDTSKRPIIFKE